MQPKITRESLENTINILEERFPDRLPKATVSSDTVNLLIGQQQVVRYLKELMETLHG